MVVCCFSRAFFLFSSFRYESSAYLIKHAKWKKKVKDFLCRFFLAFFVSYIFGFQNLCRILPFKSKGTVNICVVTCATNILLKHVISNVQWYSVFSVILLKFSPVYTCEAISDTTYFEIIALLMIAT